MESKKIKILAIDDNKDNLISLKALIKEAFPDVKILIAISGEKGLELAATEDPDVILLDIVMPDMDGFDVCGKLKADKKLSDIPLVFITALKNDKESRIRALECGAEAFLSKPIDESELTAQIRAMVKIKTAANEKRDEKERLTALVEERTRKLNIAHTATLNLLEELRKENEARKKSEETLQESEYRFKVIASNTPDHILVQDNELRYTLVINPQLGLTKQDMLGKTDYDFLSKEEADKLTVVKRQVIEAGEHQYVETSLISKDGKPEFFDGTYMPRFDPHGKADGLIGYFRNVTERKRAEKMLEFQHALLTALINSARDIIIFTLDRDCCYTAFNEKHREEMKRVWNADIKIGMNLLDCMQISELRKLAKQSIDHALKGEAFSEIQHQPEPDIYYEFSWNPIWQNKEIVGVSVFMRDITDRKQLEDALKINEASFRGVYDNMKSGSAIYMVVNDGSKGSDYIIKKFNRSALKMEGKALEEVIGKRLIDIRPAIDSYGLIPVMKKVWETGKSAIFPARIYIDERYANYYENYVFKLPSGEVVTLYDDITESKRAEEALLLEKENFHHSLDDSPLGVRITSMEGKTIYANKTILNFYGYDSLGELQKTPLKNRYSPESYAEAQKRKRQRKHYDFSATDYEISIVRKNGEIRHLRVFRKDVLWDGVRHFQVIYDDITERKKADEEIRKSKKLLEDLYMHLNEVRENEHTLISREIHDQIGQSLTALKLDLNWMHKYINTNPEGVAKLKSMIELVSNTIEDVQRISTDLRPGILDDLGLSAAIEWYSGDFEKRTGIKCRLMLDDSIINDPRKDLVLFRVIQEALTNVIRHANASSVSIILHQSKQGTIMTIKDNGIGMLPGKEESGKSLGLIGMRERVRQFGGKVDISSRKGQGTKLTVFIPEKKKIVQ